MDRDFTFIGKVHSPLTELSACPRQYSEGAPEAVVVIYPEFTEALSGLYAGQDILIFTWLHKAGRSYLSVHPRADTALPRRGVFSTRSPDRPNPIGLSHSRILSITDDRITLERLEVLNGTPVLDIKPVAEETEQAHNWGFGIAREVGEEIRRACLAGWKKNLFAGLNGNASVRLGKEMVITRSGAAKAFIGPGDVTRMDIDSGRVTGPGIPSSEAPAHLAVYRKVKEARAVIHCHPPHLLALSLLQNSIDFNLPLYESGFYEKLLCQIEDFPPGSLDLAKATGEAALSFQAVFLPRHGLITHGKNLYQAIALAEEMDNLARIALISKKDG